MIIIHVFLYSSFTMARVYVICAETYHLEHCAANTGNPGSIPRSQHTIQAVRIHALNGGPQIL